MSRVWIEARQAYLPRMWPVLAVLAVLGYLVGYVGAELGVGLLAVVVVSVVVGLVVVWVRWLVWRRRHPVLWPREVRERRRAAAAARSGGLS